MSKLRILLDVDGVVADWIGAYIDLYVALGGRVPGGWSWNHWRAMDDLPDEGIARNVWDDPRLFRMPVPYEGAVDAVWNLHEHYEVYFATAVPHRHVEARSWWFEEHLPFIHRKRQIIFTPNKFLIKADIHIEDRPKNLARWIDAWPDDVGVLIRHAYNADRPELDAKPYLKYWSLEGAARDIMEHF